eukprot:gene2961-biopygen12652
MVSLFIRYRPSSSGTAAYISPLLTGENVGWGPAHPGKEIPPAIRVDVHRTHLVCVAAAAGKMANTLVGKELCDFCALSLEWMIAPVHFSTNSSAHQPDALPVVNARCKGTALCEGALNGRCLKRTTHRVRVEWRADAWQERCGSTAGAGRQRSGRKAGARKEHGPSTARARKVRGSSTEDAPRMHGGNTEDLRGLDCPGYSTAVYSGEYATFCLHQATSTAPNYHIIAELRDLLLQLHPRTDTVHNCNPGAMRTVEVSSRNFVTLVTRQSDSSTLSRVRQYTWPGGGEGGKKMRPYLLPSLPRTPQGLEHFPGCGSSLGKTSKIPCFGTPCCSGKRRASQRPPRLSTRGGQSGGLGAHRFNWRGDSVHRCDTRSCETRANMSSLEPLGNWLAGHRILSVSSTDE